MLEKLMTKAFAALYETAQEKHCTLRMGAYVVALQRLIDAEVIKGLLPYCGEKHSETLFLKVWSVRWNRLDFFVFRAKNGKNWCRKIKKSRK